ncbi:MAG: hydrogen gas-evolving membrane-bound hydrogenase subunit E, partial [Planctomycetota bacterium]
ATPPQRIAKLADGTSPETLGDWVLRNTYDGVDTAYVRPEDVGAGVVDRGEKHLKSFGTKVKTVTQPEDYDTNADDYITLHKGGGGSNAVNVTLVDFRGFDTFGEIAVLGLAAMGVWTLLRKPPSRMDQAETDNRSHTHDDTFSELQQAGIPKGLDPNADAPRGNRPVRSEIIATPILQSAVRLLLPLAIMFSAYLFFKGHQTPGGGFVGGLATAVALVIYRQCFGCDALYRLLPVKERVLIGIGLSLATLTAVAPLVFGLPMLTSTHGYLPLPGASPYHWASVLVFDLGVYLVVVGSVVGMIDALAKELES